MAAKGLKSLFEFRDIVYSESSPDAKNTILMQTGDATVDQQNSTGGSPAEIWGPPGLASKPSPVSGSGKNADAAQAIVLGRSDYDAIIATRDTRYQDIYGGLKPGETALYGTGADGKAQGRIIIKANGSINLLTTDGNAPGATGMGLFLNTDGSITAATPSKNALVIGSDGCKLFGPAGGLMIADAGVKLSSNAKITISAPSVTIGGPAALPAAIGPNTVTSLTALQTQITALQAFNTALVPLIAASLTAIPPLVGGAPGAAAFASAAGLVATAQAAVAAGTAAGAAANAIIPALQVSIQ